MRNSCLLAPGSGFHGLTGHLLRVAVTLGAALTTVSTAYAQSGTGASGTGSGINSSGAGGAAGAGASSLNTPSDHTGGGARAPAKSALGRATAPESPPEARLQRPTLGSGGNMGSRDTPTCPLTRRPRFRTRLPCRQPSVIHTTAPSMTKKPVMAVPIKTRSMRSIAAPFAKMTLTFREVDRINLCESGAALSSAKERHSPSVPPRGPA